MPAWSYVPYTSLGDKYIAKEAITSYHPLLSHSAVGRIRRILSLEFQDIPLMKMYFLHRMMDGVLRNKHGKKAYLIVLESFGKPLFVVRNLAHTLQDPADRGVYIIHLEDALHIWHNSKESKHSWWETVLLVGMLGILGYHLTSSLNQETSWVSNIKPHALMGFFS